MFRLVMHSIMRPLIRRLDRRIDAFAVRRYHASAYRSFRLLAANETDPRIARWFEAQARSHRRFAGPITDPVTIDTRSAA